MSTYTQSEPIETLEASLQSIHELQIQVTISKLSEARKSQLLLRLETLEESIKIQLSIVRQVYEGDTKA